MDFAELYSKHKKTIWIVAANVAGVLVIVALVLVLQRAAAGPTPAPEAAPDRVVPYLASRQFSEQSDSNKCQYVQRTIDYYTATPQRMTELGRMLEKMPDDQALQFRDNLADAGVAQIVEFSKYYSTLRSQAEKERYIDQKLSYMVGLQSAITGRADTIANSLPGGGRLGGGTRGGYGGAQNLAANPKFSKDMPKDTGTAYKMFVDKTKPGDRSRAEGFVNDVQNRIQQLKTRARGR